MWDEATIKSFWENNKASYAGGVTAKEVVRLTRKHIGHKVLDVGAGSGALLRLIPGAVGLDIAPKVSGIISGSVDRLPFHNEEFDTVFAMDILEHLPVITLTTGISEISRVLIPGGKLIVTVPNNEDFNESLVLCPGCKHTFHRWGHLNWFDSNAIKEDLANNFRFSEVRALPLSLMAEHRLIRYFWPLFIKAGFAKPSDLLVVATK